MIAALGAVSVGLLLGLCGLGSYLFFGQDKPPDRLQANQDKPAADQKATTDNPPPKIDVPKVSLPGDGPKRDDKKPSPREEKKPLPPPAEAIRRRHRNSVERLNRYRKGAGLGSVQLDEELTRGCQAHAKYLARHFDPLKPDAFSLGAEDPTKPGYSVDGERAGESALIVFAEPGKAVERWMAQMVSRTPLLNPEMLRVGVGFEKSAQGQWICVLDTQRGHGDLIVVYPAPKQADVPLSFTGGPELPNLKTTAGYPITITFPAGKHVKAAELDLRDDQGRILDGWLWTPEKPVRPGAQHNTIALVPKAMLRANEVYYAKASAQVDGKPWTLAWSFSTEEDGDTKGIWAAKALALVNGFRAHAGLKPVTLDETLSRGCVAHARYLSLNEGHPALQGLKAHDEDMSLAGASKEGQTAGKASDIAIGDTEPTDGVESWMATLYHRVPILEPNLRTIGFGCARGRRFGWVTVLNVVTGRDKSPRPHAVFYPVPDQTDVPLNFPNGGEEPNPIPDDKDGRAGYPITAFFPRGATPTEATGKLTNPAGNEIPVWFSSGEKIANPKYPNHQGDTICLIAKDPLAANTTYHVHLQGQVAGKAWEKKWKFTTGEAGATVAQAIRQVVARANDYRAKAGLAPLTLDDDLGRGCQRHAEYLVKHAEMLQKTGGSVNDEDPLLPGFTAEGRRRPTVSRFHERSDPVHPDRRHDGRLLPRLSARSRLAADRLRLRPRHWPRLALRARYQWRQRGRTHHPLAGAQPRRRADRRF